MDTPLFRYFINHYPLMGPIIHYSLFKGHYAYRQIVIYSLKVIKPAQKQTKFTWGYPFGTPQVHCFEQTPRFDYVNTTCQTRTLSINLHRKGPLKIIYCISIFGHCAKDLSRHGCRSPHSNASSTLGNMLFWRHHKR